MATIQTWKDKNGKNRYTAIVRIRRGGAVIHREAKTFPRKNLARTWAGAREAELAKPGALDRPEGLPTVSEAIATYIEEREHTSPLGRTKRADMQRIARSELGSVTLDQVTTKAIIDHARGRRQEGASPSTTLADIVWLGVLFRYARSAWDMPVDVQMIDDASATLRRERVIAPSRRRDRRPTREELVTLDERLRYLERTQTGIRGSLRLIMWAAVYSARRLDELMSLQLADYDPPRGLWLVRDIKNPRGSTGNHRRMHVTERFAQVIEHAQPEGDRLFPYNSKSVGSAWRREVRMCGIDDLRFHDLRHEACSRLAEDGCTIPQIQRVSLHDSWGSLQLYVNLGAPDPDRLEFQP